MERRTRRKPKKKKNPLPIILLLLLAAAVIFLIVFLFGKAKKNRDETETETATEATTAEVTLPAFESAFRECEIPEINLLVKEYFDARLAADSSRLYEIFGRTDTEADPEYETMLKAQATWIRSFDNVKVYIDEGLKTSEKAGIITYDVMFRRAAKPAPGIMYCFFERGSDGYTIMEDILKDHRDHLETVASVPEAAALIEERSNSLREMLSSDSTLALIYNSFLNGDIYQNYNLDLSREPEIELFPNPEDSVLLDPVQPGPQNEEEPVLLDGEEPGVQNGEGPELQNEEEPVILE